MATDISSALPFLGAFMGAFLALAIILGIAIYVYTAWAVMTIGKKLKVEPTWLAWIPIANLFYIPMLAKYEWYYGFLWIGSMIPGIGFLVSIGLTIWWYWRISESRKKEGWLGILMAIPLVNLVVVGILAWNE